MQPRKSIFNIGNCEWPYTSSLKFSLGSDEVLKSYYLFIFSSHQQVQHMASRILLILIDFDSLFRSVFDLKLLNFKPL